MNRCNDRDSGPAESMADRLSEIPCKIRREREREREELKKFSLAFICSLGFPFKFQVE
jgi:hypothetical protein